MYKILVTAGIFLLTGCVVADMDSTNYAYFPYVQTFQKPATLGHTDVEQRRQDLYACGVDRKYPLGSNDETWRRNTVVKGESDTQFDARVSGVESCMKDKGYVVLDWAQCGPLKKPTGRCN
ncbi:hypothetical protein [Dryocola sp. BD626]|uniref:hypothetical protein n=1 Tax=Dryocola sp. BD626 TaxID=3133273 RepID=UPI003F5008CF